MRALRGLLRKELTIFFTTPTAFAVLALFAAVASLFFWTFLSRYMVDSQTLLDLKQAALLERLNFNDRVITPLFVSYVQIVFLFLMPLITMRLIAEERSGGQIDLLLSSPLSSWQIVAAKYLAVLLVVALMTAIAAVYPLLLQIFGTGIGDRGPLDWSSVGLGLLGLFLVGATCAAVGLFASAITRSQLVAAVLAMMFLLLLWILRNLSTTFDGAVAATLRYASLLSHVEGLARGLLSLADLVYYLSGIAFFLFLTQRAVEGLRRR